MQVIGVFYPKHTHPRLGHIHDDDDEKQRFKNWRIFQSGGPLERTSNRFPLFH